MSRVGSGIEEIDLSCRNQAAGGVLHGAEYGAEGRLGVARTTEHQEAKSREGQEEHQPRAPALVRYRGNRACLRRYRGHGTSPLNF